MKKLSITRTKSMLCIDMDVRCKRMSTAYRHFYNAVKAAQEDGAFGEYDLVGDILTKPEELDWQYNSPLFNDMENTGYVVRMEPTDDNNWYLWVNVTYKRMKGEKIMRTETTITKIYKFDELSDKAREKVIDEARDSDMEINRDELVDCMKSAMNEMGIEIEDYSIGIDGSGYIKLYADNDDLEGARAYAYILNNFFDGVNKKKLVYKEWEKRRISHLERKDWMDNCPFSGCCYDFAVKNAFSGWCNDLREGKSPSVRDFLDELEWAYLKELSDEYYGFNEKDAWELAEANGYEFLEDGTIY